MTRSEPPADVIEDAINAAIRIACDTELSKVYGECNFPICDCKKFPEAIRSAITAYQKAISLRTSSSLGGIEGGVASRLRAAPQVQDVALKAAKRIVDAEAGIEKAKDEKHPSFKEAVKNLAYFEKASAINDGAFLVANALLAATTEIAELCHDLDRAIANHSADMCDEVAEQGLAGNPAREPQISSPAGALTAEKAAVIDALRKAADQFEMYAKEHRQKAAANRHNGMRAAEEAAWKKCYVNENFATDMRAAIEAFSTTITPVVRSSEAASQSSPSSVRERRMRDALRVAKQLCDNINEFSHVTDAVFLDEAITAIDDALALSSDGRGREKGNTSNSDDGIDPSPTATDRSES